MPLRTPRRRPPHPHLGLVAAVRYRPRFRCPGPCLARPRVPRGSARHAGRVARRGSAPPAATRDRNGLIERVICLRRCNGEAPHDSLAQRLEVSWAAADKLFVPPPAQQSPHGKRPTSPPCAGFCVGRAMPAIVRAEEAFLSVACVSRWAQGPRTSGRVAQRAARTYVSSSRDE